MLLVYTHKITPRVRYIFTHIFKHVLGVEVGFTSTLENFVAHPEEKMSYTNAPLGKEFFIKSHPLLFEQGLQDVSCNLSEWEDMPIFFQQAPPSALPFDLFAASFYLLTRYEEHLPYVEKDFEGFPAESSLAFRHKFLDTPLVDLWISQLKSSLLAVYPDVFNQEERKDEKPKVLVDVVQAFKYKHKSIFRNLVQWLKAVFNLNLWEAIEHPLVLMRLRQDPWGDFTALLPNFFASKKAKPLFFFFQFTEVSFKDQGITKHEKYLHYLIKATADYCNVSLLVSQAGRKSLKDFQKERIDFQEHIHHSVRHVRFTQNLRNLNESYKILAAEEIHEDYSMGYPNELGYRASTAIPFYFFDLANDYETALLLHPVVATENWVRKKTPQKAIAIIEKLHQKRRFPQAETNLSVTHKIFEKSIHNAPYSTAFNAYICGEDGTA